MKKIIGAIVLLITVLTACKNKDAFTLEGKFENAPNLKKVSIYKGDKQIDSAILNENGEFKFEVASPDADFYYIAAEQKTYPLIAINGDELTFKADFSKEGAEHDLRGSDNVAKLKEFSALSNRYGKIYVDIQKEYEKKVSANPAIKDSLEKVLIPRFEQNMEAFTKETIAFSEKNKDNLAGFYAMSSLDHTRYQSQLIKYAKDIEGKF
ncbi:MAG: DUF4369 domain-containing protein, partial [Pyrinomonadaceae bacterium]|nr:DUF4369 domain-containing protein [Sphingobacteriaceae bacterium]